MNKNSLLRSIAETGYNVGFGGKKHFVTYDLYRIFPRLISTITISIGIIQLTDLYEEFVNAYVTDFTSALLIIIGILGLVIDFHGDTKDQYEKVGKQLLHFFNELRGIYEEVKNLEDDGNLDAYKKKLMEIDKEFSQLSISKQAIGTHIITHFGFFKVMQSKWVVEELNLTWKDKFPFLHWESILLFLIFSFILIQIILFIV